jgi:hypothetical protein
MSEQKLDYPIAFLNEVEEHKKNEFIKVIIDCFFDGTIDVQAIQNDLLRKAFIMILAEADQAATISEQKLNYVMSNAHKLNREERRKVNKQMSAKERAKAAGLVVLEAPEKEKKLIIP